MSTFSGGGLPLISNMSLPSSTGLTVTASSLIVVSNRLPFVLRKKAGDDSSLERKASAGGLVTAVAPVVVQSGGLWVGWPGLHLPAGAAGAIPESDPGDTSPTAGLKSSQVYPCLLYTSPSPRDS